MAKHIKDIETAWELLHEWCEVASTFNNDGILMAKELARMQVKTERLLNEN